MMKLKDYSKLMVLILSSAVLLAGCAHPDFFNEGVLADKVVDSLGQPDTRVKLPDGHVRWIYSEQKTGQTVWWMIFDQTGRMVEKEQVLNRQHFSLIEPKKSTKEDVFEIFGEPYKKTFFSLANQAGWMYRFRDEGMFDMAFWVQFDTNGVVTETSIMEDTTKDEFKFVWFNGGLLNINF